MKRLYTRADWEKRSDRQRNFSLIALSIYCLSVFLLIVGVVEIHWLTIVAFFLGIAANLIYTTMKSSDVQLEWWRKHVAKSEDAAREFAAMVEWQSDYVGLKAETQIQFSRKADRPSP